MRAITVFLSCPGDLLSAKDALSTAVQEVARHFRPFGMAIDIWRHDPQAIPGVGHDAQAVVARQMPPYQIYVGMLCGRLGTPTAHAASGTLEEFLQARQGFLDTGCPEVLFYFCASPPDASADMDRSQRAQVVEFQQAFPGLFGTFHSVDALRAQFKDHLIELLLRGMRETPQVPRPWLSALALTVDGQVGPPTYLDRSSAFAQRLVEKARGLLDLSALHPHELDTLLAVAHARALVQRGGSAELAWRQLRAVPGVGALLASAAMEVAALVDQAPDVDAGPDPRIGEVRCGFLAALMQLLELLDLDHAAIVCAAPPPQPAANAALSSWLAYHTRRIEVRRPGVVSFSLLVSRRDGDNGDGMLISRYAAMEFETQWHQRRRVLANQGVAVARAPTSVMASALVEPLPATVRERMRAAADQAEAALPRLLHLQEPAVQWPTMEALLPLPASAVVDALRVSWQPGRLCSLQVWAEGGAAPMASVPPSRSGAANLDVIGLVPAGARHAWLLLEDAGGFHVTVACGEVWTLTEPDRIRWTIASESDDLALRKRWMHGLGLWNDLLQQCWPALVRREASPEDARLVHQVLLSSYDWLRDNVPDSGRIDTIRNAAALIHDLCLQPDGVRP